MIAAIVFLLFAKPITGLSQKDSTAYQKFFAAFLASYQQQIPAPNKNFLQIFSLSAQINFSGYNPLFQKALAEMQAGKTGAESEKVEALYWKCFTDLKPLLWVAAQKMYADNEKLFSKYHALICPCISAKLTSSDRMEAMLSALNQCSANISKDTAYVNNARMIAAGKTASELNAIQSYAFLYVYQHCDVVFQKISEVVLNEPVLTTYLNEVEETQRLKSLRVIEYYQQKKFDSLSVIFPNYRKFTAALDKAIVLKKAKGVELRSRYFANSDREEELMVDFLKKVNNQLSNVGRLTMKCTASALDSRITAASFSIPKNEVDEDEKIEEIKEQ